MKKLVPYTLGLAAVGTAFFCTGAYYQGKGFDEAVEIYRPTLAIIQQQEELIDFQDTIITSQGALIEFQAQVMNDHEKTILECLEILQGNKSLEMPTEGRVRRL